MVTSPSGADTRLLHLQQLIGVPPLSPSGSCLSWASLPHLGFSASLGLLCLLGLFAFIGTIGLSLVVPSLGPRPPGIEPVLRSLNTKCSTHWAIGQHPRDDLDLSDVNINTLNVWVSTAAVESSVVESGTSILIYKVVLLLHPSSFQSLQIYVCYH